MFTITFLRYGNDERENFPTIEEAIEFIKENLNDEEYSGFALWQKMPVTISIEI